MRKIQSLWLQAGIFLPYFFYGRDIRGITLGKRSEGKMSCVYVMLWHKRGEWWGIGMDGSLHLWSYSPSFSARLSSARVWWQSGISSLWITAPFLSHWRHLGVLNIDDGSSLLYHPSVWFLIYLSTFFWRFEALILPAVTRIFLSFEKWVIMNWWVTFAVTFENYIFWRGIWGQIFNSNFLLNWGLISQLKFHNIFTDFLSL